MTQKDAMQPIVTWGANLRGDYVMITEGTYETPVYTVELWCGERMLGMVKVPRKVMQKSPENLIGHAKTAVAELQKMLTRDIAEQLAKQAASE